MILKSSSAHNPAPLRQRWAAAIAILAIFCAGIAGGQTAGKGEKSEAKAARGKAGRKDAPDKYPPLPDPEDRVLPLEASRPVYYFVAEHPELVKYIPCYCVCGQKYGHKSVEDCYIRERTVDGGVVWSDHSMACLICISVGQRAKEMLDRGASAAEIRRKIDEVFAGSKHRTPTPQPPGAALLHPTRPANPALPWPEAFSIQTVFRALADARARLQSAALASGRAARCCPTTGRLRARAGGADARIDIAQAYDGNTGR